MIIEDYLRKLEDDIAGINERLMQVRRGTAADGVTASANITDHSIARGDGGAKGIQGSGLYITDAGNLLLGSAAAGAAATKTLVVETGTPPAGNSVDSFQMYSADFAAGNACPTFRTENGTIIQLNQGLLTTASPQFVGLTLSGHLALGGTSINADYGINYNEVLTDTDNSEKIGFRANLQVKKTAAAMTQSAIGFAGFCRRPGRQQRR